MNVCSDGCETAEVAEYAVAEHDDVGDDEGCENGRQDHDGFLDAPDVQNHQEHDEHGGGRDLKPMELRRQVAEQGVNARSDGDSDRQNVVDDQRTAGNHARSFPEHMGRHDVAAAAVGEMLDDSRIGIGDDAHSDGGSDGQEHRQIRVASQRPEGLFRTVRRGRQSIRSQPHPSQQGNERQLMKEPRVLQICGAPNSFVDTFLLSVGLPSEADFMTSPSRKAGDKSKTADAAAVHFLCAVPSQMPAGLADGLRLGSAFSLIGSSPRKPGSPVSTRHRRFRRHQQSVRRILPPPERSCKLTDCLPSYAVHWAIRSSKGSY